MSEEFFCLMCQAGKSESCYGSKLTCGEVVHFQRECAELKEEFENEKTLSEASQNAYLELECERDALQSKLDDRDKLLDEYAVVEIVLNRECDTLRFKLDTVSVNPDCQGTHVINSAFDKLVEERDKLKSMVSVYEAEHDAEAKKDQTLMEENLYLKKGRDALQKQLDSTYVNMEALRRAMIDRDHWRKQCEAEIVMRTVSDEGYRKLMKDFVELKGKFEAAVEVAEECLNVKMESFAKRLWILKKIEEKLCKSVT